jgi:hypothetical protein
MSLLKPISEKDVDSYVRFLATWLGLFIGLPMLFGALLKPVVILILVVGLDFIWHKLEDIDFL